MRNVAIAVVFCSLMTAIAEAQVRSTPGGSGVNSSTMTTQRDRVYGPGNGVGPAFSTTPYVSRPMTYCTPYGYAYSRGVSGPGLGCSPVVGRYGSGGLAGCNYPFNSASGGFLNSEFGWGFSISAYGLYPCGAFWGGLAAPCFDDPWPPGAGPAVFCPSAVGGRPRLPARDAERMILDGLKRLKLADYRGAVDAFRSAIIESDENVRATAYFALGLVVTSDGKNADKALRAAAALGFSEKMDFTSLFKDDKECARIKALLGGISGEGLLTAAWAEFLAGAPDRLKRLAEKDPVAKQLLSP